jgi:hypothetical protein
MAVYKVPQDVEADDKLIGPFSFRQFIYLIIVAISMGLAWLLAQAYIVLAVIPLPVILFFGILALPLRKDQPMEAYLSAVVSFYFLKSRKRLWQPDGIDSFVTIIPPKNSERILTKGLDESEASRRLDYLAELVDTHGWAIRGAGSVPDNSISKDVYYESQVAEDMFDSKTEKARAMNERLNQQTQERRKEAKTNMQKVTPSPAKATGTVEKPISNQLTAPVQPPKTMSPADVTAYAKKLAESASTQKKEISKKPPVNNAANTSVSTPDTGTMELTRKQAEELSQNNQLSVKTLAEEANRIAKKNKEALLEGEEVTISLR